MGDLQSAFQEHRNILDQTHSLATSQGQLLATLQQELRQSTRSPTIMEGPQTSEAPPGSHTSERMSGAAGPCSAMSWSTTVALRLMERHDGSCKCSYRQPRRFRSPPSLSYVFGSLFIGYVGIPNLFTQCGSRDPCCKQARLKGSITYVFPLWFIALIIMVQIEHSQRGGPQILIRSLRVRSFTSAPFQAIAQGQFKHVKTMVLAGQSSILDVSNRGDTLLSVSKPTK